MKKIWSVLLFSGATLTVTPSFAHHSAVMFDMTKNVTFTGVVTEFQYTNPHSWLIVEVKNADGTTTTWGFEAEGPSSMMRIGIKKSDFKPGTQISIIGHPMKNGQPAAVWRKATRLSDGKEFSTAGAFAVK